MSLLKRYMLHTLLCHIIWVNLDLMLMLLLVIRLMMMLLILNVVINLLVVVFRSFTPHIFMRLTYLVVLRFVITSHHKITCFVVRCQHFLLVMVLMLLSWLLNLHSNFCTIILDNSSLSKISVRMVLKLDLSDGLIFNVSVRINSTNYLPLLSDLCVKFLLITNDTHIFIENISSFFWLLNFLLQLSVVLSQGRRVYYENLIVFRSHTR